jgi:hypothetical protein
MQAMRSNCYTRQKRDQRNILLTLALQIQVPLDH